MKIACFGLAVMWPATVAAQDALLAQVSDQQFVGRLISQKHGDSGPMQIISRGTYLTIRYEDLQCEGRLDALGTDGDKVLFRETITGTAQWCWERGLVRLTPQGDKGLTFGWSFDADTPASLSADLTRVDYGPTPDRDQIASAMNLYMQHGFSAFEGVLEATHDMPAGMLVDCTRKGCNFMDIAQVSIAIQNPTCEPLDDRRARCQFEFSYAQNMQDWIGDGNSALLDGVMSLQAAKAATAEFDRNAEGWFIPLGQIGPVH